MSNKKIAITGGIGSGKSTVAKILREYGFPVFSCDEIYGEIVKSEEYIQKIQEFFPSAVIHQHIDKQKLARIVFSDENHRKILNSIAHPLIMKNLLERMEKVENKFVFAEVPLLFEEHLEHHFHEIWVVMRNLNTRVQSAALRDQCDEKDILNRIRVQFDYESDSSLRYLNEINAIIIENNQGEDALKAIVQNLIS